MAAQGDITDADSVLRSMEAAEVVYHVAAHYEIGTSDPAAMRAVNVEGTRNVLEAALRSGVPNVVYCGTVATLGPNTNGPGDESQRNDGLFRSHYETTKCEAHEVALEYASKGLPVRIAMPSAVYGPGDRSLIGLTCRLFVRGWVRFYAFPNATLTFTHVDDTAAGLRLVAERGRAGESYILAGEILTFRDWMGLMSRLTGRRTPRLVGPDKLIRQLMPLFAPLARLAGLPPRVTTEGLAMAGRWAFTSAKAERELGWRPRSAEVGFAETLESFGRAKS